MGKPKKLYIYTAKKMDRYAFRVGIGHVLPKQCSIIKI